MRIKQTKQRLAGLFREYWNDFLTVDRFAAYYDITAQRAARIIDTGRKIHNNGAKQ